MNVKNSPTLFSKNDECKWAGVTKVQGKHPSPSFSRRRKSRNTVSQEWTSMLKKCYEHYGLVYMRHAHFILNEVLKGLEIPNAIMKHRLNISDL